MELIAEKREKFGKDTQSLRREGKIPAVIFGKGFESLAITLDYNSFKKILKEAGETSIVDLKLPKEIYKVLIKDVELNPVTDLYSHIGFYKPDLTKKINAQVPVEVIGEDENDLIKAEEAMALTLMNEITVKCLPTDIPQAFIVNVSSWDDLDKAITVAELEYDKEKVELEADPEEMVVKLAKVEIVDEAEEEELTEEEALAQLEATEEGEVEEGDASTGSAQETGSVSEEQKPEKTPEDASTSSASKKDSKKEK